MKIDRLQKKSREYQESMDGIITEDDFVNSPRGIIMTRRRIGRTYLFRFPRRGRWRQYGSELDVLLPEGPADVIKSAVNQNILLVLILGTPCFEENFPVM